MKSYSWLIGLLLVLCVPISSFGQGIQGSKHDFSNETWANSTICLPCHVPHNSLPSQGSLWNHEVTNQTFTMYTTVTGQTGQLSGKSKLCLSCHDGVTAIDSYGGSTGSTLMTGTSVVGTDLTNDHPIGIQYPPPSATVSNYHDPPQGGVKLLDVDGTDQVECSSCHDVHNNVNFTKLLRDSQTGSQICLDCHNK
jgi:predicted CXXCH cytochrome family protein